MTLLISSELHRQLIAIAAESADVEVCGLLVGRDRVERIVPAHNVAGDPRRTFEVDPQMLFAAIRNERSGGERLIGYYHSHPTGLAAPSPADAAQATADDKIWLIIAGDSLAAWRMQPDGKFAAIGCCID